MKEEYFILAQSTMKMVAQFANTVPSIARALDPNNTDPQSSDVVTKFHFDLMILQMKNALRLSEVEPEKLQEYLQNQYKKSTQEA